MKSILIFCLLLFVLSSSLSASENKNIVYKENKHRIALVIANQSYSGILKLRTPFKDGKDLSAALRQIGFTVETCYDLTTREQMLEAIQKFGQSIVDETEVLFYYGGHGVQVNGENFLIPTQANPQNLEEVKQKGLSVDSIYSIMKAPLCKRNIIIISACRNNLFADGNKITGWVDGLAPPSQSAPDESIIAYATDINKSMPDEPFRDGNSLYARALLKFIYKPGVKIEDFFKSVQSFVSKNRPGQRPWYTSSLSAVNKEAYFKEPVFILAKFGHVDDEATVLVNGKIVMNSANDGSLEKRINLEAGGNKLEIKVFNVQSYDDVVTRLTPQGWNYTICFYTENKLLNQCLSSGENRPVKKGPRHGNTFLASTANIVVDEITGAITFHNINQEYWRK